MFNAIVFTIYDLGFVARCALEEDDAGDACQEAFISAYRNIGNFRGEAKLSSWLHRIAVNQCLTIKRRQKTRAEDLLNDDDGSEERTFVASPRLSPARTA